MNKADFVRRIAEQRQCTQIEVEKTINMFTSSVIDAMGKGNEISLIGFGNFSSVKRRLERGVILAQARHWKSLFITQV